MKRTAIILFTLLYLVASSGILLGQHLCMDRVKETALFKKVEKNCGMSMEMHQDMEGCCDDEWSLKKVEDDQQVSLIQNAPVASYHLLYEVLFSDLTLMFIPSENELEVNNTGPPDIPEPERYILFHALKIPSALQS